MTSGTSTKLPIAPQSTVSAAARLNTLKSRLSEMREKKLIKGMGESEVELTTCGNRDENQMVSRFLEIILRMKVLTVLHNVVTDCPS